VPSIAELLRLSEFFPLRERFTYLHNARTMKIDTSIARLDLRTVAAMIVHVFSTQRVKLVEALRSALSKMRPDGAIWVSWPKKASKMETDITEDTIREVALPMGLVDIKVCAVDHIWSALKLLLRKERRKSR
jgi:hypothetical protein